MEKATGKGQGSQETNVQGDQGYESQENSGEKDAKGREQGWRIGEAELKRREEDGEEERRRGERRRRWDVEENVALGGARREDGESTRRMGKEGSTVGRGRSISCTEGWAEGKAVEKATGK